MDYKQIAKEVIEALGGRENVNRSIPNDLWYRYC